MFIFFISFFMDFFLFWINQIINHQLFFFFLSRSGKPLQLKEKDCDPAHALQDLTFISIALFDYQVRGGECPLRIFILQNPDYL